MQASISPKNDSPCPLSLYQAAIYLLYCRSQPPLNRLFNSVIREVCSYLPSHLFAVIPSDTHLNLFDVRTETWRAVQYPAGSCLGPRSRYLYLGDEKIFACGGNTQIDDEELRESALSNYAFLLSIQGEVESLPSMQERRDNPGLTQLTPKLFVFGGCRLSETRVLRSQSCESFSLIEKKWSRISPMKHGRCGFSPCVWRQEIYLCGGGSAVIEVYTPSESAMREVPMLIAASGVLVSFVRGEELVGLSTKLAVVLRYEGEELITAAAGTRALKGFDQQSPVIWAGKVYIPQTNECIAVDIETLAVVQEYPLTNNSEISPFL